MKASKVKVMSKTPVNAAALQSLLVSTIDELRSGKTDPGKANSIAALSRETCRIAKLQMDYYRLTNTKPSERAIGLLQRA